MKKPLAVLSAVLLSFAAAPLFGQAGSNLGLSFPKENWNMAGRRMGGVSVAIADNVPQLLGNPANLAALNRPHLFLSVNNASREFKITKEDQNGTPVVLPNAENPMDVSWTQGFDLGYSAVSLPFHLFKRQWVAAASYNGRPWGEFDERYFSAQNGIFGPGWKNDEQVQSATAAIGTALVRRIRAGVSWTKWFGKFEWEQEGVAIRTDDYAGQAWQLGIAGEIGRFSLASTVHFPRRVMKSRTPSGYWLNGVTTQQAHGAMEIGIGYQLQPRWTFGLGYLYQRRFEVEQRLGESQFHKNHRGASQLSAGIAHELSLARVRVPVYVGYLAAWLAKDDGMAALPFILISEPDEARFRSQLVLGAAIGLDAVTFHADSRLTLNSSKKVVSNLPPYS